MIANTTIYCVICCNASFTYLPWNGPEYMLECGWERHEKDRWICPDCIDRRIDLAGESNGTRRISRADQGTGYGKPL